MVWYDLYQLQRCFVFALNIFFFKLKNVQRHSNPVAVFVAASKSQDDQVIIPFSKWQVTIPVW